MPAAAAQNKFMKTKKKCFVYILSISILLEKLAHQPATWATQKHEANLSNKTINCNRNINKYGFVFEPIAVYSFIFTQNYLFSIQNYMACWYNLLTPIYLFKKIQKEIQQGVNDDILRMVVFKGTTTL